MTMKWRETVPTTLFTYDPYQFDSSGYLIPEKPAPSMAEINALMDRIQAQHRKRFPDPLPEPTQAEVARAMEERFEKTEAREKLLAKLKDEVLGAYGVTERQISVVPRTYQQRKARRKKAQ